MGRELALKLANQHSTVICIDVQTAELESTCKKIGKAGGSAFYYQCDVTSRDQVERTIKTIEQDVGEITMLYHCCSLPSPRVVVTNPPSIKQTIDVSITSYFYVSLRLSVIHVCMDFCRIYLSTEICHFYVSHDRKKKCPTKRGQLIIDLLRSPIILSHINHSIM